MLKLRNPHVRPPEALGFATVIFESPRDIHNARQKADSHGLTVAKLNDILEIFESPGKGAKLRHVFLLNDKPGSLKPGIYTRDRLSLGTLTPSHWRTVAPSRRVVINVEGTGQVLAYICKQERSGQISIKGYTDSSQPLPMIDRIIAVPKKLYNLVDNDGIIAAIKASAKATEMAERRRYYDIWVSELRSSDT